MEPIITTLLYQTHRSKARLRFILLKIAMTIAVLIISIALTDPAWKFFKPSVFLNALNLFLVLRVLCLAIMVFTTRHPFSIYQDHIVTSHLFPIKLHKEKTLFNGATVTNTFERTAVSEKTKRMCLVVTFNRSDTYESGKTGNLEIPWGYIKETEEDVLAKIDEFILNNK